MSQIGYYLFMGSYLGSGASLKTYTDEEVIPVSYLESANKQSSANDHPAHKKVAHSKSQSSFVIPPHRKATGVIVAATGETVQREYADWITDDIVPPARQLTQLHLNAQSPISNNFIISYLKSLFTIPILKAAFTYFIASLFVYSPTISNMLGSTDSKHIICTVVVYFHSSRSIGSMFQSLMFVAISLIFGITVSVSTMKFVSAILKADDIYDDDKLLLPQPLGHEIEIDPSVESIAILITLVICSVSLGTISFFKHRISKPTFNTSCSLCAILIISCLIKESSKIYSNLSPNEPVQIPWGKIRSSIQCILVGCVISVAICFLIWRQVAKTKLIKVLNDVEQNCGEAVDTLCDAFIGERKSIDTNASIKTDIDVEIELVKKAKEKTADTFKTLQTHLRSLDGSLEETLFECYLTGNEREYQILKKLVECEKKMAVNLGSLSRAVEFKWDILEIYKKELLDANDSIITNEHDMTTHDFMDVMNNNNSSDSELLSNSKNSFEPNQDAVVEPQELFDLFFYYVGPSTRSFVFTMTEILRDPMFDSNSKVKNVVQQYNNSLDMAKSLYQEHQKKAIDSLYKQGIFSVDYNFDGKVSHEEIAATCANFSFSLTQFSTELSSLLQSLNELRTYYQSNPRKTYKFLKFWKWKRQKHNPQINVEVLDLERGYIFAKNSNQQAKPLSYKIWELTRFFRSVDFQFGLRVALGALLLGSLAYAPLTKHIFNEWRGEWALVTFCIIMNKSLGGTVMTVKWRFLGTFVGAFTAYWVWVLFFPNVLLMALSGLIVAIPCFGIILNWKNNNAFGRFILLTYNLTVLYSYTMSLNSNPGLIDGNEDWEGGDSPIIFEIAFHRYLGVSAGVVWALIITLTLFPMSARARIKQGLTKLWLRMGLIWKRGPLSITETEFGESKLIGLNGLMGCHKIQSELAVLQKQAPMEIRLKGSYPELKYQKLISCTSNILDSFENMNSIIEIESTLTAIEKSVLTDLKTEMKELENRVFLMFYMLSSAMTLGLPLLAEAAGTEHAMEKVVVKLSDVRRETIKIQNSASINKQTLRNEEFVLFYTYCLVTEAIVKQLHLMMVEVVGLYDKLDEDLVELL